MTSRQACFMALGFLGSASLLAAQPPATIDFRASGARVHSSIEEGPLTPPSDHSAAEIVIDFLAARHATRTLSSLALESEVKRGGLIHLRFQQIVGGLVVYGTYVKATVNEQGELIHLIENLDTPPVDALPPALVAPEGALTAALDRSHPGRGIPSIVGSEGESTLFDADGGFFFRQPRVTRVAVPLRGAGMEEGYVVETWEADSNLLHYTLVGRTGRILRVEPRTSFDSYNVFIENPEAFPQTIVPGPGSGSTESPTGWLFAGDHSSIEIAGNNAHAYLDTDANNSPDSGGATISSGDFVSVASLASEPDVVNNQEVAVQNLFYLCNTIHDELYRHGFAETEGNFQQDNFGLGGAGGDPVLCEAQDGSSVNNANFATPSDGTSGRLQMFLWNLSTPRRDGALDADIVWHEYGHGLTWRMIGGMSGPIAGAVGEGMGDALAILIHENDVLAEYAFNNPAGIRSAPYTGYPRTYGDFTGTNVHFDGEIYAAIVWDLWQRFQAEGLSRDLLLDYLIEGMRFTPAGPAFEDMRDGILQAVSNRALGHECLVWGAFSEFGVGTDATSIVSKGGPSGGGVVKITEDFSANCGNNCRVIRLGEDSCEASCACANGTHLVCGATNGEGCAANSEQGWIQCGNAPKKFC